LFPFSCFKLDLRLKAKEKCTIVVHFSFENHLINSKSSGRKTLQRNQDLEILKTLATKYAR
jgi:hypothetical protein